MKARRSILFGSALAGTVMALASPALAAEPVTVRVKAPTAVGLNQAFGVELEVVGSGIAGLQATVTVNGRAAEIGGIAPAAGARPLDPVAVRGGARVGVYGATRRGGGTLAQVAVFPRKAGRVVLRVGGVEAVDASGRRVPVRIVGSSLTVRVGKGAKRFAAAAPAAAPAASTRPVRADVDGVAGVSATDVQEALYGWQAGDGPERRQGGHQPLRHLAALEHEGQPGPGQRHPERRVGRHRARHAVDLRQHALAQHVPQHRLPGHRHVPAEAGQRQRHPAAGADRAVFYPVITSATTTTVKGAAPKGAKVELYTSWNDPGQYGPGRAYLTTVTANATTARLHRHRLAGPRRHRHRRLDDRHEHSEFGVNVAVPGAPPAVHGVTFSSWEGFAGNTMGDIPLGTAPTSMSRLESFEAPSERGDNLGTRLQAIVTAPASGEYTFWIASDDNSRLLLSGSDDPAGRQIIAKVDNWTPSRAWDTYASQKSQAVTLVAGQRYYLEAFSKEGGGGDNLAVAWSGPGIARQVIPADVLSATTAGRPAGARTPRRPPCRRSTPCCSRSRASASTCGAPARTTARRPRSTPATATPTSAGRWRRAAPCRSTRRPSA